MPEEIDLYQSQQAFGSPTFTSEWKNISSSQSIIFTAYATQDFTMSVRWATDNLLNVIDTDVLSILANNTGEFILPVKARFVQLYMTFAANPVDFTNQFFFFQ